MKKTIMKNVGNYKKGIFKLVVICITAIFVGTLISSCNKEQIKPEGEYITQSFGIFSSNSNIGKNWDYNTWQWNYNPTPATLTLTGVGNSEGNNYTLETTIAALRNGTASITMLKGTYNIEYETPHIRSTNPTYVNGTSVQNMAHQPHLSENIDIKVNMVNVNVTGTPITLTSSLEDLLIVVDVPNLEDAFITINNYNSSFGLTSLIRPIDKNYRWGYFAMDDRERGLINDFSGLELRLNFTDNNPPSIFIDAKDWELGKVYHIQSHLGATAVIDIPDFEVEVIVVF